MSWTQHYQASARDLLSSSLLLACAHFLCALDWLNAEKFLPLEINTTSYLLNKKKTCASASLAFLGVLFVKVYFFVFFFYSLLVII